MSQRSYLLGNGNHYVSETTHPIYDVSLHIVFIEVLNRRYPRVCSAGLRGSLAPIGQSSQICNFLLSVTCSYIEQSMAGNILGNLCTFLGLITTFLESLQAALIDPPSVCFVRILILSLPVAGE